MDPARDALLVDSARIEGHGTKNLTHELREIMLA
jgi:hypothetical protein